jgi:hypothetical protein
MTTGPLLGRSLDLLGGTLIDVGPLIATLFGFQLLVLKRPVPHAWRVIRGLVYVVIGLVLFLLGLEQAVFPLGHIMAHQLTEPAFLFGASAHMPATAHWQDYGWVYAFGFCIGLSTTLAEPALIAVGMKAEAVSGGAISAWGLRMSVAVGVATGVALGCFRIVTGTDLWVYIIAAYVVVILQSLVAPRVIVPLAYDSGGVTTSTVTVPLLAALGLGLATTIPGRSPVIDGFGLIAFASVFPIMSVMAYAQLSEWWTRRQSSKEEHDAL